MDLGRTIDYIETRPEFDKDAIAYYGYSMGAEQATPAVAVEPRLKTAVFLSGGLSRASPPYIPLPEVDPVNFLPRIPIPTLFMDGRYDFTTQSRRRSGRSSPFSARRRRTSVT
jgi:dienelactone hydrolase